MIFTRKTRAFSSWYFTSGNQVYQSHSAPLRQTNHRGKFIHNRQQLLLGGWSTRTFCHGWPSQPVALPLLLYIHQTVEHLKVLPATSMPPTGVLGKRV